MTQRYKVDVEVVEKGLEETIRMKINNLETYLEEAEGGPIKVCYKELMELINIANGMISVQPYFDVLTELSPELKNHGIEF